MKDFFPVLHTAAFFPAFPTRSLPPCSPALGRGSAPFPKAPACSHHSRIIRNLLGELAEKNLRLNEKLTHMGQRTTRAKLMSYFSAEAQRRGGYEFDIPFSRQQLADYLGVERSGLSVELGKMRDEGLLDFHKSHFLLKVPED